MRGLCMGLATLIQFSLPVNHFTISWMHSVEKIPWQETYSIQGDRIIAESARIEGAGAGMDFPDDAVWHKEGYWTYHPHLPPLKKLRLTRSHFTMGYNLCWDGHCKTFTELLGPAPDGTVVELFACPTGTFKTAAPASLKPPASQACTEK